MMPFSSATEPSIPSYRLVYQEPSSCTSILTVKVLDHTLFPQHLTNRTSTEALQLLHKNHRTPYELFTLDQSLNAGIMAAMVDNSPPSATSFDISERNQEFPASHLVRSAGQSSRELLQEMGIWPTRSASRGGTRITELGLGSQIMQSIRSLLLFRSYFWHGVSFGTSRQDLECLRDILRRL